MSSNVIFPPNNGSVHNIAQIMKNVTFLAADAELGALCLNANMAIFMQTTLQEMVHMQPPMPIKTDTSTTYGIIMNKIIPKVMKAIHTCFHWLHHGGQWWHCQYYWGQGTWIMPTIGQNNTQQHITKWWELHSKQHHTRYQHPVRRYRRMWQQDLECEWSGMMQGCAGVARIPNPEKQATDRQFQVEKTASTDPNKSHKSTVGNFVMPLKMKL